MRVRVDYIIRIPFYGRYAVPGIRPIESATEFGFWNSEIGIVNYENDLITLAFHTFLSGRHAQLVSSSDYVALLNRQRKTAASH